MPVELIGMIGVKPEGGDGAAVHVIGGEIDLAWLRAFSQAHEKADFDRVLVGYTSTSADGFIVASHAAAMTERLSYLIAHRPGFVAPTLAARTHRHARSRHEGPRRHARHHGGERRRAAARRRFSRPRHALSAHRRVPRCRAAHVDLTEPFDHEGEFYRVTSALLRGEAGSSGARVPLYFGGASGAAARVGGKHCDVYALWGEPLAAVKERIDGCPRAGRGVRTPAAHQPSLRPIIAPTEAQAWERAHRILAA